MCVGHQSTNSGIRVAKCGQVRRARPRVQLGQQTVIERLGLHLGHAAIRIVHIAKHDRIRRARGLAGRDDIAVLNRFAADFGIDLRAANSLDAVGALFHNAAAANRDIRIATQLQTLGRKVGVLQES